MERVFAVLTSKPLRKNVVYSPHAITRAMALLALGSEGQAKREIAEFLGYSGDLRLLAEWLQKAEARLRVRMPAFSPLEREAEVYEPDATAISSAKMLLPLLDYRAPLSVWLPPETTLPPALARALDSPLLGERQSWDAVDHELLADKTTLWLAHAAPGRLPPLPRSIFSALRAPAVVSALDLQLGGVPGPRSIEECWFHTRKKSDRTRYVALRGDEEGPFLGCDGGYRTAWWYAEQYGTGREPGEPFRLGGAERADVWLSLPIERDHWPGPPLRFLCSRGDSLKQVKGVHLTLSVPMFQASSVFNIGIWAEEFGLVSALAGPPTPSNIERASVGPANGARVSLIHAARLAFDARATFNQAPVAAGSPRWFARPKIVKERVSLILDRPFVVTIHDPGSRAILYVAIVSKAEAPQARP